MNWTHFALVTYAFGLAVLLLLIARRLFRRPVETAAVAIGSSADADADSRLHVGGDFALLERIARLTQENEALRGQRESEGAAVAAEVDAEADAEVGADVGADAVAGGSVAKSSMDDTPPAWNEAMAGVLRAAGTPGATAAADAERDGRQSALHLSRPAAGSVARLAISPDCLRPADGTDRRASFAPDAAQGALEDEPESVASVRTLIRAGLNDETIAIRLRLSLSEIGLIRRLPAPAAVPAPMRTAVPAVHAGLHPAAPPAASVDAAEGPPTDWMPATARRSRTQPHQKSVTAEAMAAGNAKSRAKENRKTNVNNIEGAEPATILPAAGKRR